MSYTSSSQEPLTITPKNGDGTGTVDISGTIIADIVYSPGMVVRMQHFRQDPNNTFINNVCSFTPISISNASTIIGEAYFNYTAGYNNFTVTLSGINESNPNARDSYDIISYNQPGGEGRRSGRPLIISKDILANTSTTFTVSLTSNPNLKGYGKITFIFSQVAK